MIKMSAKKKAMLEISEIAKEHNNHIYTYPLEPERILAICDMGL